MAAIALSAQLRRSPQEPSTRSGGGSVAVSSAHDADLLRTLHDEHARAIWAYVVRLTNGDTARADDVVQETLLRAWRHPQVLDQSQGSARAWLLTVARRIVIDEWRGPGPRGQGLTRARAAGRIVIDEWRARGRRSEVITADVPEAGTDDQSQRTVDSVLVTAALNRL